MPANRLSIILALALGTILALSADTTEAQSLNIALEAPAGAVVRSSGDVFGQLSTLLTARGHTVTIVDGQGLDSQSKINVYDVVVLHGSGYITDYDWAAFDPYIVSYVTGGGGLVNSGWGVYEIAQRPTEFEGLEAALPFFTSTAFFLGGAVTLVSGHPITDGLTGFSLPSYDAYGAGPKPGATVLSKHGTTPDSAAWELGGGRVVYFGPIFVAGWETYNHSSMLDGSVPDAQELFLRAVEWAGGGVPPCLPRPNGA